MNILFITDLYPGNDQVTVTDVSFSLHYFVREWVKQPDIKVQVLVLDAVGLRKMFHRAPEPTEVRIDGVNIMSSIIRCKAILNHWIFSTRFIRRYLKKIQFSPDVIVSHMPIGNEVNLKLHRYYDVPFICGIHESDIKVLENGGRALKKANNIAWRSYGIKKRAMKWLSPEQEYIAVSGIESDLIVTDKPMFDSLKQVRFITVARLLELKNIDVVLDCLALLPASMNWTYTIVGSGVMEKPLMEQVVRLGISKRVKFMGQLPRKECIAQMDVHDVFVMVSSPETFGMVYLEALARGLLVIGAKECGIDGVITDGVNGYLCAPREHAELTAVLHHIFTNDVNAVVKTGVQTVQQYIDTSCADNYLNFIRETVNKDVS